jgi:hypothetical protein
LALDRQTFSIERKEDCLDAKHDGRPKRSNLHLFARWHRLPRLGKKHPTLSQDRTQMSHKFKHGALKYEIAVSNYHSQVCWIGGPHRGGKHDLTMFREGGLKQKFADGKLCNVDRGYHSGRADEKMLCLPNLRDSKALNNFKSRSRLRGETFNGRLKTYEILNQTFRGGNQEKHRLAFEAVVVIWQYRMDNGEPLFEV